MKSPLTHGRTERARRELDGSGTFDLYTDTQTLVNSFFAKLELRTPFSSAGAASHVKRVP
jgi:hypothetical protein